MKIFLTPRGLVPLGLVLLILYAWQVEPYALRVRRVTVRDDRLFAAWGNLRILHISDLHISGSGRRERAVLRLARELRPDLVLLTGDISQWGRRDCGPALAFVRSLGAPLGVYGVLGDADEGKGRQGCRFCHPGTAWNRRARPLFLQNEVVTVSLGPGRGSLRLAGIEPAANGVLPPPVRAELGRGPVLILHHFPTLFDDVPPDVSCLLLAGDSHGGQVRLPGAVRRLLHLPPSYPYLEGLFRRGRRWLFVTRGVGVTARFPFRLGVRPEVALITIAPGGGRP